MQFETVSNHNLADFCFIVTQESRIFFVIELSDLNQKDQLNSKNFFNDISYQFGLPILD